MGRFDIAVHVIHLQGSELNPGRDTLIGPKGLLDICCSYLMVQSDSELGNLTSHP